MSDLTLKDEVTGNKFQRSAKFLPWMMLLAGIASTYFLQQAAVDSARQIQQDNFDFQTREIVLRIEQRLSTYEQVLRGLKGLYVSSKNVDRDEFHRYADNLHLADHYPGIQGVGYSVIIPQQEQSRHVEAIRKEGFPDYRLHPGGVRDLRSSIVYLEPFAGRNLRAFGYDMYSEPVRRAAMEQARDSDSAVMSGKVTLVQEVGQQVQAGFLMYVPVYRNGTSHETLTERRANIAGWVFAPFRLNDLMRGILGEQISHLDYEIFDGERITPETLMYDSDSHLSLRHDRSLYHVTRRIEMAGHVWHINLRSLPDFEKNIDTGRVAVIRLTGVLVTVLLALLVWLLLNGRARALGLAQQMTAQLQTAQQNETRALSELRAMLNTSGEGFWKVDQSGVIIEANDAYCHLVGYAKDDVVGAHVTKFEAVEQTPEEVAAHVRRIVESGYDRFETRHRHHDGHPVDIEVVAAYISETNCFIVFLRDMTERKEALEKLLDAKSKLELINHQLLDTQNKLLQSDKMASIGQLAAGVAHEINNPIGYVYSNLGTLEKYLQDTFEMLALYEQAEESIADADLRSALGAAKARLDIDFLKEDLRALMNESKDGITRVKNIVQNLKDFSHADTSDEWHRADLHSGLESTLNIVNNEIKYKAEVVREYGSLPDVECLASQLNQVFMNLLVNAAHAIEEHGTITVRTGYEGDEVWVEIADTGKGVDPAHIEKIFDPFFTTKPVGQGTGLGLSLSYGIVQKHHGRIEVSSEVGRGTAFRVWLPVKQPDAGNE